ncbi:MAG TPA: hypothetical protein VF701_02840 [Thermoanaerobaculia bacterium]
MFRILLALLVALTAQAGNVPPSLQKALTEAGVEESAVAWCACELQPSHPVAFAVAVTSDEDSGRHIVVAADGRSWELAPFSGAADLACYSVEEARQLHETIQQSETVEGSIAPRGSSTVICGFTEDTNAVCWQYSPDEDGFVRVGAWQT